MNHKVSYNPSIPKPYITSVDIKNHFIKQIKIICPCHFATSVFHCITLLVVFVFFFLAFFILQSNMNIFARNCYVTLHKLMQPKLMQYFLFGADLQQLLHFHHLCFLPANCTIDFLVPSNSLQVLWINLVGHNP